MLRDLTLFTRLTNARAQSCDFSEYSQLNNFKSASLLRTFQQHISSLEFGSAFHQNCPLPNHHSESCFPIMKLTEKAQIESEIARLRKETADDEKEVKSSPSQTSRIYVLIQTRQIRSSQRGSCTKKLMRRTRRTGRTPTET